MCQNDNTKLYLRTVELKVYVPLPKDTQPLVLYNTELLYKHKHFSSITKLQGKW